MKTKENIESIQVNTNNIPQEAINASSDKLDPLSDSFHRAGTSHQPSPYLQKLRIPSTIKYSELPETKLKKEWIYYFLHAISTHKKNQNGYTQLETKYLRTVIPFSKGQLSSVKKYLIDNGIVECDRKWARNIKCLGYRISTKYLTNGNPESFRYVSVINPEFSERIEKSRKLAVDSIPLNKVHKYMEKWYNSIYFNLSKCKYYFESIDKIDEFMKVIDYTEGNRYFNLSKYGRVYHSLCSVHRNAKNFISFNNYNSNLIEIDICSCQPTLLIKMIKDNYNLTNNNYSYSRMMYPDTLSDNFNNNSIKLNSNKLTNNYSYSRMMYPDTLEYINLVENNKIYDVFIEEIKERTGKTLTRQEIKELSYSEVFFATKNKKGILADYFNNRFPNVAEFIKNQKKKSFRDLSRHLQREESNVIIDTVCKKLMEYDMPVLTIHDAVIVPEEAEELVTGIINDYFKKYDINVKLKVNKLGI